jgi:hypothetical protein
MENVLAPEKFVLDRNQGFAVGTEVVMRFSRYLTRR